MKAKVLVVDDEKDIRELINFYLNKEGFEVLEASNGEEALEIFENEYIDLGIIDVMMPVMDGFELVENLKEFKDVPVIMLTAMSDDYTQIMSFDEKADDYITKPFSIILLHKRIEALLRRGVKLEENRKWNYKDIEIDFEGYSAKKNIDVYIKNIRKKLSLDCIVTVKGIGYKFEEQ